MIAQGERSTLIYTCRQSRSEVLATAIEGLWENESIDFLRLSIKYMLFDLEATRRENAYLRKMLEGEAKEE